ncbi:hypothetical protein N7490_011045 [Penicillium lividum]|nr:hypothetical protein N7490_011045 [Penicillium lividum]
MPTLSASELCEQLNKSIVHHENGLDEVNRKIFENPELAFEEVQAHDNICDYMEKLGFSVTRHAYGLKTSFEVEYGSGGRLITYNAEYDALPDIGHACGHNLIATSSVAAFLATVEAVKASNVEGRVRLLGTPAEEDGGGKIPLIKAGAYKGVDACLMAHPQPANMFPKNKDGAASMKWMARKSTSVSFHGKNAHAGVMPWAGKNALDAVVASYVNVSLLRQQIEPEQRVHGIIREGGGRPNIIPALGSMEYYARAATAADVDVLCDRVSSCFEGAAIATCCTVKYDWDIPYADLRDNTTMNKTFAKFMSAFGRDYIDSATPGLLMGGSSDMGNVSYEVPGFHCGFMVETDDPSTTLHHLDFTKAAGSRDGFVRALDCAKGMAATGYTLLTDDKVYEGVKVDFKTAQAQ